MLQGRYVLAMLFEYAATLGLIDVAYIAPQGARLDYDNHWGTDDYECLSRYDGLEFLRLNALGAWCLGLTKEYELEPVVVKKTWRVLPNHDVVSSEQNPDPGDVLFLDRVAERTSDRVWRLDREKILTAAEGGFGIEKLSEFLQEHSAERIPDTVLTLLDDLRQRAGRLSDQGDRPHDPNAPTPRPLSCSSWTPSSSRSACWRAAAILVTSASPMNPPCEPACGNSGTSCLRLSEDSSIAGIRAGIVSQGDSIGSGTPLSTYSLRTTARPSVLYSNT